jgi:nucleoside-diphosphate-sugar epimerase
MILVTGGTGLVGAHLLHLIESQSMKQKSARYLSIYTFARKKQLYLPCIKEALLEQIRWICADITDVPSLEIAFQNINMVYHCAALISFDQRRRTLQKKILKAQQIL